MAKNLAIYFDGTWNSADQESKEGLPCPTNITKLFEATDEEDKEGNPQIVQYIRGVGTDKFERIRGGGFGYGISDNIKEGYSFIVSNYEPGDHIYIFGFSRGAYTARSLAGMIRNVGILKREKLYLVNKAYENYKNKSEDWLPDGKEAVSFKNENTRGKEKIRLLGVFDTVGALGAPFGVLLGWLIDKIFKCSIHDTKISSIVQSAYHALAVDERRLPFMPTPMYPSSNHNSSNFEQKWFPGVHSNVGGGYSKTGLSDCALEWMVEKAKQNGLNLNLNRISSKAFNKNIEEAPENSQTKVYQIATLLLVKLPGYVGLVPKKYKNALKDIQWNGDYVRPIPDKGDIAPFLSEPPRQPVEEYTGNLHSCVIEKILKCGEKYQPKNVI